MKHTYHIVNNYDAKDFFPIEAENENDAAFEGLRQLGHFVVDATRQEMSNKEQYEFDFQ
jgi:hypothetical protein